MKPDDFSCMHCIHFEICKCKPDPYMGTSPNGIRFDIPYEEFRKRLFILYGRHCKFFQYNQSDK